ncbi:MAG: DUF4097 domain-containing protein [Eubacterium sp.]|nr:DUF4097 domain-containing protein [Eubacterium sp.]
MRRKRQTKMAAPLLLLAAITMTACGSSEADMTSVNDAGIGKEKKVSANVEHISLEWTAGEVVVQYDDVNEITFVESSEQEIEQEWALTYTQEDKDLSISFCEEGGQGAKVPDKTLVITLPKEYAISQLDANLVSADLTLPEGIQIQKMNLTTDSGDVTVAKDGEIGTLTSESVSGNLSLNLTSLGKLTSDSVSADVTLSLPKDSGFVADTSSLGGEFQTDFETKQKDMAYYCGDRSAKITMTSISGDLTIASES